MTSASRIISVLILLLFSCTAFAEDHAVLIGAGKYASGKWELDLVDENIRLMEKVLVEEVGLSDKNIKTILDSAVTRNGVRRALLQLVYTAGAGDRLFIYYTGHACKVLMQGAPIRAHFTWDTMEAFGGEGFDPETLITDIDLKGWLRPFREKGVFVIVIREACFCGGGYAQDIARLSPGKAPAREPVCDIELSACDIDQAAWALEGATKPVALFTSYLADCLASDVQKISARFLHDSLRNRVSRKQKNQTPTLDFGKGVDPAKVVLVDRTLFDLVVDAVDAVTAEPLSGVRVELTPLGSEKTVSVTTPAARLRGLPRQTRVFPWIEKDGYVPRSHAVEIPQRERTVRTAVELTPEISEVRGRITTAGSGNLSGVIVTYESASRPVNPRHVDPECKPRSDGSFHLQVPPRGPCRILVVKGTDTLASLRVNNGAELSPVRYYDRRSDRWAGETYDVGEIMIDLGKARPAMTEAERAFEEYYYKAEDAESAGNLEKALRCFDLAKSAAGMVDDAEKRKDLATRAERAEERVEGSIRTDRYDSLVSDAKSLLDRGELDAARAKLEEALRINNDGAMARILLEDAGSRIQAANTGAEQADATATKIPRELQAVKKYRHSEWGFSIDYPKDWSWLEDEDSVFFRAVRNQDGMSEDEFLSIPTGLTVGVIIWEDDLPAKELLVRGISEETAVGDLVAPSPDEVSGVVDGKRGEMVVRTYVKLLRVDEDRGFAFMASSPVESWDENWPMMKKLLKTFQQDE